MQTHNRNKRLNRSVSPLGDHSMNNNLTISPDCFSKFNYKENGDINCADSRAKTSTHPKQFFQSPISTDYAAGRKRRDEEYWSYSLSELNLELDNNMNQVIFLLSKRKNLVAAKKRKVKEDIDAKLSQAKNVTSMNQFSYANDKEFLKIVDFCKNTETAVNILTKLTNILPNISDPNQEQKQKSEIFWEKNKVLQNDIDSLLDNLKSIDKNLEKQNSEIHDICKQLDRIQGHLKSFVGARSTENVQRVQPLFEAKKKKYDILNRKIKTLQNCKDNKIDYVKTIRKILQQLLQIRQKRLKQIASFFGLQSCDSFSDIDFKDQDDFTGSFEELLKIKEKDGYLETAERQTLLDIDCLQRDQQRLYNELLKKQSDEAKAYHSYNDIITQRAKYSSILSLFGAETQNNTIFEIDPKQLTKKFQQYKGAIKIFLQEQNSLRQGLVKTMQTSKTFANLLSATQNEKQRRYELLSLLETCIRRRGQYQHKKEDLRNLAFDQSQNLQYLSQYEQQLQTVLTDGDIEAYKQIGQAIGHCEQQKSRMNLQKQKIERQMQIMDKEVISMANKVKHQYEDILCDIVPSDYQYSLKNGEDVKKLRNHLRKMYKRLGILSSNHESN